MEPTALRKRLVDAFTGRPKVRFDVEDRVPAAVLILIFERDGEPWMVFTRRTQHVSTHKGEISFPGGARDPEDADLQATGIRETVEELGIDASVIDVVCELDDYPTFVTNYVVTPFVALIPQQHSYTHSEREIDEVIELPVRELAATLRQEDWSARGRRYPMYFYETRGYTIWGVTGYILTQFLSIAGDALGVTATG
jgi:8-oxo-dGTP pyrophosphatase MutT (NUDIX family)